MVPSRAQGVPHAPVTVVIPCYRCADTLERAVNSVLAQTLPPAQLVLVEDASGDGGATLHAAERLRDACAGKTRVRVIAHERNQGAPSARNTGWDAADGELVAFLDADDAWHPSKLAVQASWMSARPDVAMSGHRTAQLAGNMPSATDLPEPAAWRVTRRRLLMQNVFPTRTVMLRRELPMRFNPGLRRSDDYLLWLEIVASGRRAWLLEAVLAYSFKADYGDRGLSADLWAMERSELTAFKELAARGLLSPPLLACASAFSLLKYCRRLLISATRRH